MTKSEFEERTGYKVAAEEFEEINAMYMAAGEMDKDLFCRLWKQCGKNPLARELASQAVRWEESCREYAEQITLMDVERHEFAAQLLGKSRAYEDTDFRRMAVRMVGERKVVSLTVQMGLPLWDEDKAYIAANLK